MFIKTGVGKVLISVEQCRPVALVACPVLDRGDGPDADLAPCGRGGDLGVHPGDLLV